MHGMRTADIFDTERGSWPPAWWGHRCDHSAVPGSGFFL